MLSCKEEKPPSPPQQIITLIEIYTTIFFGLKLLLLLHKLKNSQEIRPFLENNEKNPIKRGSTT